MGFTRCGRCDVDLVDDLSSVQPTEPETRPSEPTLVRMTEFCGFLGLEDARSAREQLRERQIPTEILIRDVRQPDGGIGEEYWIRVDQSRLGEAASVLDQQPAGQAAASPEDGFECGDCGHHVAEEESFCPNCGARFEDD